MHESINFLKNPESQINSFSYKKTKISTKCGTLDYLK